MIQLSNTIKSEKKSIGQSDDCTTGWLDFA